MGGRNRPAYHDGQQIWMVEKIPEAGRRSDGHRVAFQGGRAARVSGEAGYVGWQGDRSLGAAATVAMRRLLTTIAAAAVVLLPFAAAAQTSAQSQKREVS